MIKTKKTKPAKNTVLSHEELCIKTKNTLKDYIKANTFGGFATGFAAGVTLLAVQVVEDTQKKIILGSTGAILTAASIKTLSTSFKRMDDFIDNHDDAVKLHLVGRFLDAKGNEAREELLDVMVDELHSITTSNSSKENSNA